MIVGNLIRNHVYLPTLQERLAVGHATRSHCRLGWANYDSLAI
ncbi:hypothetical protein [Moorena sp. SIOASIH]|nr:hypothetical protein [Moorena sp. SIOASIH]